MANLPKVVKNVLCTKMLDNCFYFKQHSDSYWFLTNRTLKNDTIPILTSANLGLLNIYIYISSSARLQTMRV